MNYSFTDRLKHAWNVFKSRDPTDYQRDYRQYYGGDAYRPDYSRPRFGSASDRSIIVAIKNRIAVDSAQIVIQHVKLDDNERYVETIHSGLNYCLNTEANIDQTGRAFRLDIFMSLLDDGVIAIVPVDTTLDPEVTGSYQINDMRVGKITQWYPQMVRVQLYNEKTGNREEVLVPKKIVAIVENPFYSVMNAPNSTFQRLTHKLALLDAVDEQSSAGKLDLIIQLPYVVKTEQRKAQANQRRKDIEEQLNGSKYGIAYTDGTERIQQLNRPLENNLLSQIQYLTELAYSQLGITADILNGTADEKTMLNYNNRIIEPLVAAVADAMKRSFLTKTAITQHQSIEYFRDPFALVPINNIAEIADKFTRNEITTSNEIRQAIGMKPSADPNADTLRNKNLYDTTGAVLGDEGGEGEAGEEAQTESDAPVTEADYDLLANDLDNIDSQLDALEESLKHDGYTPQERHEYYIKYEKQGRLKGYNTGSTTRLNEEGQKYKRYVREMLGLERDEKNEASKASQDAGIESSKQKMTEGIETSAKSRDSLVSGVNSLRDIMIKAGKKSTDEFVKNKNEERDRSIDSERKRTKSEMESYTSQTQTKIDILRKQLSNLSKEDKATIGERVKEEIADLRNTNKLKKAELQEAFKTTSNTIRSKTKEAVDAVRKSNAEGANKFRERAKKDTDAIKETHSEKSKKLREEHKSNSDELREKHKANKAQNKKDYEDQYAKELEFIQSLPEYQAAAKSSGSSSSSSVGSARKDSDGKLYVKRNKK